MDLVDAGGHKLQNDEGKVPFVCTGCKGEQFLFGQCMNLWYKIVEGAQGALDASIKVGGTPQGMAAMCLKCRKTFTDDDISDAIRKIIKAPNFRPDGG